MKKPLAIKPEVLNALSGLPRGERSECLLALCDLAQAFGQPHIHGGLGIRKLGKHLFECRAGLSRRLLFLDRPGDLFVVFLGNHDEVRLYLRSAKLS